MKIAMACDHGAFEYKEEIKAMLTQMGHEVKDFGCYDTSSVDYPDMVVPACKAVAANEFDRGVILCGTGIGVSIVANKVKGIRCALVHDVFSAKATRQHNDTNMIAMGQRVIGEGLAIEILNAWLHTDYEGGRHDLRIQKMMALEEE